MKHTLSLSERCSRRDVLRTVAWGTLALAGGLQWPASAAAHSENVFLVLVDGLRWQEVFGGADQRFMNAQAGGVSNVDALKKEFWRETPEARRETLLPFLWNTVAKQGQLLGNRERGSVAKVENPHHFSYPGYSEMIVGYVDPRINSNGSFPNPNVSVFEWLHQKPAFRNKVAAFGAWQVVPYIINRDRCGFYVNGGVEPVTQGKVSERQKLLNELKKELHHPWGEEPYDAITFRSALEYIQANKPRAFWLTFGETDEFAHSGRYDHYLQAARRTDGFLQTLWNTLQSMRHYRGRTTLIVTVDHGRGTTDQGWKSHGANIPGADEIWMGFVGAGVPALGERRDTGTHTLSQIPATLADLLGEDYRAAVPKAAPSLLNVLQGKR